MITRKLTCWQEWLEAEKINAISFLHPFNKEKAKEKYIKQAEGKQLRAEEAWGCFTEDGTMTSSLKVYHHRLIFDGQEVACGEIDMVSSLPEARENGNIRSIVQAVFDDLLEKGFAFSFLHPFSFSYYRQYGYELCSSPMSQKLPITELKNFPSTYRAKMIEHEEDLKIVRNLYEQFIQDKNFSVIRPVKDWKLREDGGFGPVDFFNSGKTKYSYLFTDEESHPRGYIQFTFKASKENFLVGTLKVVEMIYDSPDAFRNIMGFIYKMRAKCETLSLELPETIDMATLIPNGDKVERKYSSHGMARILNVQKALELMRHPEASGSYTLEVTDDFLPQNTGFYTVSYAAGKAHSVVQTAQGKADITVTIQTLCQMILGLVDLNMASYRCDVKIYSNQQVLSAVFIRKNIADL